MSFVVFATKKHSVRISINSCLDMDASNSFIYTYIYCIHVYKLINIISEKQVRFEGNIRHSCDKPKSVIETEIIFSNSWHVMNKQSSNLYLVNFLEENIHITVECPHRQRIILFNDLP